MCCNRTLFEEVHALGTWKTIIFLLKILRAPLQHLSPPLGASPTGWESLPYSDPLTFRQNNVVTHRDTVAIKELAVVANKLLIITVHKI